MKYAAIIDYTPDKAAVKAAHPEHRTYFRTLLENGTLAAAGPRAEDAGALWIVEAESTEQADALVRADPSYAAGVFTEWKLCPLAYWSAKEAKGS